MKMKGISERVQERLKKLEKVPAHQHGRMRSVLVPGPEKELVEESADDAADFVEREPRSPRE